MSERLHAPGSVVAENLHSKYAPQIFAPVVRYPEGDAKAHGERWQLDINTKELRWESYVKAGYYVRVLILFRQESSAQFISFQGVLNHHFSVGKDLPASANLLVTGSVPAGSGLSSSAAMVVASTLAFLAVNGKVLLGLFKSFNKNHI